MVILVCGSRDYTNNIRIEAELRPFTGGQPNVTVIHGAARGADTVAGHGCVSQDCTPY
jgi:YspA, cpYpsA-related SLOG family